MCSLLKTLKTWEREIRRNIKEHIFVAFLNCAERDEPVDVHHRHNRIMSQSGQIQLTLESQLRVIRSHTINSAQVTIAFHGGTIDRRLCD